MRIRHEYKCAFEESVEVFETPPSAYEARNPTKADAPELADLMLDSYQGTIDYDGESIREAIAEVESYFKRPDSRPLLPCSFVLLSEGRIISACLISNWVKRQKPLISYIMTRSSFKGRGLGGMAVRKALAGIRAAGYVEAYAVVTEGNIPSEKLLIGLGFKRVS